MKRAMVPSAAIAPTSSEWDVADDELDNLTQGKQSILLDCGRVSGAQVSGSRAEGNAYSRHEAYLDPA